jgi:hypothetical protein
MVLALEGAHRNTVRAMQPLLSGVRLGTTHAARHWQGVERDLGDDEGC